MIANIWLVEAAEFADYCELCGYEWRDYEHYREVQIAVLADLERRGIEAEFVRLSPQAMREALGRAGLNNTPENRAAILLGEET